MEHFIRPFRFNSAFPDGEVTTFRRDDLAPLKDLLSRPVETIKVDLIIRKPSITIRHFLISVPVFIRLLNKSKCLPIIYQNIRFQV